MTGHFLQRGICGDRVLGDDDATGVNRRVPRIAFELACGVDDALRVGIALIERLEIGNFLHGFRERREHRYEFRYLVAEGIREAQCPPGIPDGRFGRHGPEGDDLCDMIASEPLPYIFKHVVPTVIGEVHVDVRHRDTFRVEEPLEEEVIFDRVDVCDAGQVGDE